MLTQAIVLLAVYASGAPQEPTAKGLIEKMLTVYHDAKTLTGEVRLTVAAGGERVMLETKIQYERPAKLYIFQQKSNNADPEAPAKWLVTSDGEKFSYQVPNNRWASSPGLRLVEPVTNPRLNVTQDIGAIYTASSKSIGDRSMPLDIAIAQRSDLVYRTGQWGRNYTLKGATEINGKTGYIIGGELSLYNGSQQIGWYEMVVTKDGELLRYSEKINVPKDEKRPNDGHIEVVSQWDVNFKINGKVDPQLFKVVVR